ncbi:MAG: M23 family metallopeptidase [Bacteroidales bacterium]|jgi:murein DD-endopeptidase MepM/ murein hydrolase activator NlpD|nr:M23 family metallopeptidase [Bacteroidales bacterium]
MKKQKTIFEKSLLFFMIIIIILGFNTGLSSGIIDVTDVTLRNNNSRLKYENMKLINQLSEITNKVLEMEETIEKIHKYDNIIYSQYLGVDFDTTNFIQYRNDSARFIIDTNIIFSKVTDRAAYAAEMLATQLTKLQETSNFFKSNKNPILYYPTISPIKAKDFIKLTSPFGWRNHPTEKKVLFHEGVDISARVSTPIYSTAQGRVAKIMHSKYGYGNRVVIKHAYGFETLYAHMGIIYVRKGQWINKNQLIGTVGNTGLSTGPHLHYEIRKNNQPRDPLGYFYTNITEKLYVSK